MADVVGAGLPFWGDNEAGSDWDTLILGGTVWPGVWEISGDGVQRSLDMKKSKGSDTATLKDEGYKNAKLTATGTIWTPEQFAELQAIIPEIHPRRKGGDRKAMQIVHPMANLLGIDSVYLKGIKIPRLDKPKGGPMTITIDLIEWSPKPKKVKNASGGCGSSHAQALSEFQWAETRFRIAGAQLQSDPNNVTLINEFSAAQIYFLDKTNKLQSTPCGGSGNQARAEEEGWNPTENDLVNDALNGLADAGDTMLDALDSLGDWLPDPFS